MKTLSVEQVEDLERSLGAPVKFLDYPGIGTVVVKQADEAIWTSFERSKRQVMLGKGDLGACIKNLVSGCLVHPTPVEFDAAVRSSKRWKAWEDIGDIIVEWAGGGEATARTLGKD